MKFFLEVKGHNVKYTDSMQDHWLGKNIQPGRSAFFKEKLDGNGKQA